MDITVVGTSVKPLVFNRRNVIILCDAVSLLSFSSWRDFIAFNPNGVAALPSPKILAAIFDEIYPKLSWFFGISLNIFPSIGYRILDILFNNPLSLAIVIIPSHKTITGNMLINISKLFFALVIISSLTALILPLININENHILFII